MNPPAPARGKSILVHVCKRADPPDEDICKEEAAGCRELEPTIGVTSRFANAWYIIRDTATTGPKISEIFSGLKKHIHTRLGTNCFFLGTDLYEIGVIMPHLSNQIRRLDTKNIDAGWKIELVLPYDCANATTAVSGNFIYLFPRGYNSSRPVYRPPWCYIYDTIKKRAFELNLPSDSCALCPPFCVPLDGERVLIPVVKDLSSQEMELYVHETDGNKWKRFGKLEPPMSVFQGPNATSNGIFYVYKFYLRSALLYAFEISSWKFLGPIWLPKLDKLDMENDDMFIVPVADSELCFLWHKGMESEKPLYYAKISVSVKSLEATLLKQAEFGINALEVITCLPCASFSDDEEEKDDCLSMAVEAKSNETFDSSGKECSHVWGCGKKRELKELDTKDHCMYKELKGVDRELQMLLESIDRAYNTLPPVHSRFKVDWKHHCTYLEGEIRWVEQEYHRINKRFMEACSSLPRPPNPECVFTPRNKQVLKKVDWKQCYMSLKDELRWAEKEIRSARD